jgi:hypothetical protein
MTIDSLSAVRSMISTAKVLYLLILNLSNWE